MVNDPIKEGLARGWKVIDAATLARGREIECDVVVVGSGAGGGVTAEILAHAGLDVAIVEEGPLVGSSEFRMREREAYPRLYQESAGRQTLDKAITILQGRCVGGGTTVNWTSSFRTPPRTLAHWATAHGLATMTEGALAPWFARMEERLAIGAWGVPPNENNDILRRGCQKLGLSSGAIRRNVKGCADLGYCGMGCPLNAKQSMLVTTIPAALDRGATLVHRARVTRLVVEGERIVACEAHGVERNGAPALAHRVRIRARHFVLAAGAIGSPGVLLASAIADPHGTAGKRTFLHPTVVSGAVFPQKVEGYYGAPQSIYSDHFLDLFPLDGPAGFKLEAPPVHPILAGITLPGFGAEHARWMTRFPHLQVLIALLRDGFHPESAGGQVALRDGWPVLDYPISDYLWRGVRRAYAAMAEIQFAAGATQVMPLHEGAAPASSWREARAAIEGLALRPLAARVVSAHVMGGCVMGNDPRNSVVNESGRHHHVANLSIHDGSVFPTSIGANPQLTIYALSARMAQRLAQGLKA
ncbi:MAG: GMC family oxidoreductase [Pseudomonadota bacterium]|nr:GMC family oxidoreductase [Pseudomonadota bacterium]